MNLVFKVNSPTEGKKTMILPVYKVTWEVDEFGPVDIIIEGPLDTVLLLDYYIGGSPIYASHVKKYSILIARMSFEIVE